MKKVIFLTLFFTGLLLNSQVKNGEITLPSVLNKYYVAVAGSKEKLEQIKSLVSEGEMSFSQFADVATFTNKLQNPNKTVSVISVMGQTLKQGFDGTKGFSNVMQMSEEQSEEMKRKKGIFSELYYTEKEATLEGIISLEGKDVYKVVVSDGKIKNTVYFDVQTGFKVREEIAKEKETITKDYSDYKDFEGYRLSTKMTTKAPGQTVTQTVKKYIINPVLTDADFKP